MRSRAPRYDTRAMSASEPFGTTIIQRTKVRRLRTRGREMRRGICQTLRMRRSLAGLLLLTSCVLFAVSISTWWMQQVAFSPSTDAASHVRDFGRRRHPRRGGDADCISRRRPDRDLDGTAPRVRRADLPAQRWRCTDGRFCRRRPRPTDRRQHGPRHHHCRPSSTRSCATSGLRWLPTSCCLSPRSEGCQPSTPSVGG